MSNSDICGKINESGSRFLSTSENFENSIIEQENAVNYISILSKLGFSAAWVYLCKQVADKFIDDVSTI